MYQYNNALSATAKRRDHKNDCVPRALALAFKKDYDEIYDLCEERGKKKGKGMTRAQWERLIKQLSNDIGKKPVKLVFHAVKGEKRMTAKKFVVDYPKGTYIIRQAHHLATIIDGILYDKVDSSERCIYIAYKIAPLYAGDKVFIGTHRNKFVLLSGESGQLWCNDFFTTIEEIKGMIEANEFYLISNEIATWDKVTQTPFGRPIYNIPAENQ